MILIIIISFITLGCAIGFYYKWTFSYWKRKGLPYIRPTFPFGTAQNPLRKYENIAIRLKKQCLQLKSEGHKHGGIYFLLQPMYLPVDPDYIKNILTNDFQYFNERGLYYNEKDDPLTTNLLSIEGPKWKPLRAKLTPVFTSGKMKLMFPSLVKCGKELEEVANQFATERKPFDAKRMMECFTSDCIGCCAFSLDCNSFKNPNNGFKKYATLALAPETLLQSFKNAIAISNRKLAHFLKIKVIDPKTTDFFINMTKEAIKYREETHTVRKDLVQILLDLKNNDQAGNEKESNKFNGKGLTLTEMAAQAFVFFLGGFETSSITLAMCLYELGLNQNIQEKLRDEINSVLHKHGEDLTYEGIHDMKYLGQVIDETLRKYPPLPILVRRCEENYKIPNTEVILERGTRIMISVLGLHHDPEYYPNPEVFNPDRFSEEGRKSIKPFTFLPFGDGPRNCIGLRFGQMQVKVGLVSLLKHFRVLVNKSTNYPLTMNPLKLSMEMNDVIWLDVEML